MAVELKTPPPVDPVTVASSSSATVSTAPACASPSPPLAVGYPKTIIPQYSSIAREKRNWLIHMLYTRQDYAECLKHIETQLLDCKGQSEYALFVKALIKRQEGQINESLQLFQAAACLNPHNVINLKQVGRSLYLLGKHQQALEVYDDAQQLARDDWEIAHNKGLCFLYLKNYPKAIEAFKSANTMQRHDCTYLQLGKVSTLQEDYKSAIDVYLEALDFSPENPEILTTIGLLYLRLGENFRAVRYPCCSSFLFSSCCCCIVMRRLRFSSFLIFFSFFLFVSIRFRTSLFFVYSLMISPFRFISSFSQQTLFLFLFSFLSLVLLFFCFSALFPAWIAFLCFSSSFFFSFLAELIFFHIRSV